MNVDAQLSLAAGNERNQSEPFFQSDGVYTELCSESMMVISMILKLLHMILSKK